MANIANEFFNRLVGTWENKLNGEWRNDLGWNFISQPSEPKDPRNPRERVPSTHGYAEFDICFMQMQETIKFKNLEDPLRNVGRTGKVGHWVAMPYEVNIRDAKESEGKHKLIHQEMGHFMMRANEDGTAERADAVDIIRQATIPRGNAMLTSGKLRSYSIKKSIRKGGDIYDAEPGVAQPGVDRHPAALPINIKKEEIDKKFEKVCEEVKSRGGPDFTKPLSWLAERFEEKPARGFEDWVFEFRNDKDPTEIASGQRVEKPVDIGHLLSDFWISQREIEDETYTLLQYAQVVDLIFYGFKWPHVAVNTLIRQPD